MADQPTLTLKKKKRIPLSGADRNVLTVQRKEPGFMYRFVNNVDDRIQKFLDAGYEPVTNAQAGQVGDTRVDSSTGTSSIVEKGVGGGKKAILMRIPEEFYKEDQKAKQDYVDDLEASMKREAKKDRYGKLEVTRGKLPS
jgi:hypothetical protein